MKRYKVKEIIEMLEADGWVKVTTRGSYRQYKHPTKKGRVTVNGAPVPLKQHFQTGRMAISPPLH